MSLAEQMICLCVTYADLVVGFISVNICGTFFGLKVAIGYCSYATELAVIVIKVIANLQSAFTNYRTYFCTYFATAI